MLLQVTAVCVGHQSKLERLGNESGVPAVIGNSSGHERILADRLHGDSSEFIDGATSRNPSRASTPCVVDSVSREFLPFVVHCLRLQQPIVHRDVVEGLQIARVSFCVD